MQSIRKGILWVPDSFWGQVGVFYVHFFMYKWSKMVDGNKRQTWLPGAKPSALTRHTPLISRFLVTQNRRLLDDGWGNFNYFEWGKSEELLSYFRPPQSPLNLYEFYTSGNEGSERLCHWCKATELVIGRVGILTKMLNIKACSFPLCHLLSLLEGSRAVVALRKKN